MTWMLRPFRSDDTEPVVRLWEQAGLTRPWNDPRADIRRKLEVQPELFLVAETEEGTGAVAEVGTPATGDSGIIGSVMAGYDGHRGWLHYLAVAESHRRQGVARALVTEAERLLLGMGCPKVQLMVRGGNEKVLGFYDALGYERFDVSNTGKRLIADA